MQQSNNKDINTRNRRSSKFKDIEELVRKENDGVGIKDKGSNDSDDDCQTIDSLHPYKESWCIKARITKKSELKNWKNASKEGVLFNVDLVDRQNTEISCTFFNEAAKRFYPLLDQNKVYVFSNGKVQLNNNRKFTKNNDHVILFDEKSNIVLDHDNNIVHHTFNFSSLKDLSLIKGNFDLLAIILHPGHIQSITTKQASIISTFYLYYLYL